MFLVMYKCNHLEQITQEKKRERWEQAKPKQSWFKTKEPDISKIIIPLYALPNVYDNMCPRFYQSHLTLTYKSIP